jgi:hypothetical protein
MGCGNCFATAVRNTPFHSCAAICSVLRSGVGERQPQLHVQAFPLAAQMHAAVWPRVSNSVLSMLAANVLFDVPLWRHYMSVGTLQWPLEVIPCVAECCPE